MITVTAQEMFERLGYAKTYHDEYEIVYSLYIDNEKVAEIEFDLSVQTFYCSYDESVMEVSMNVLKAINQQCLELGWLDD